MRTRARVHMRMCICVRVHLEECVCVCHASLCTMWVVWMKLRVSVCHYRWQRLYPQSHHTTFPYFHAAVYKAALGFVGSTSCSAFLNFKQQEHRNISKAEMSYWQ